MKGEKKECTPFRAVETDAFRVKDDYSHWFVDGVRLYRSAGDSKYGIMYHHFAAVHATQSTDRNDYTAANFVFEVPQTTKCFGSQNAANPHSSTVGAIDNSKKKFKRGHAQRMVRVLKYGDLANPPALSAKGYQQDANGFIQTHHDNDLRSIAPLNTCVASSSGACEPIRISDVIALSHEVIRGRDFAESLYGAETILPWDTKRKKEAKAGMDSLVKAWSANQVPFDENDVLAAEMRKHVAPELLYANSITCRSFAYMLKYAVDALAKQRVAAVHAK